MSKIKWFVRALAYGFALFIGIRAVFGRTDPTPLILLITVSALGFIGYYFYQGYPPGQKQ